MYTISGYDEMGEAVDVQVDVCPDEGPRLVVPGLDSPIYLSTTDLRGAVGALEALEA